MDVLSKSCRFLHQQYVTGLKNMPGEMPLLEGHQRYSTVTAATAATEPATTGSPRIRQ